MSPAGSRLAAIGQALLVTFLWSTSWVLIRLGLHDLALGPLGFAGLRYTLAAAVLVPLALRRPAPTAWIADRRLLGRVALLGVVYYALTQGTQFVALGLMPAAALSLALSTTPVLVALVGAVALRERPSWGQVAGIGIVVAGVALFPGPASVGTGTLGLIVAAVSVAANAAGALLGRSLAVEARVRLGGALPLTAWSMAIGGLLLLGLGLAAEGAPPLTPAAGAIVLWLALVNTAAAFTLWNHTLRTLTAVESSVVNTTMTVQIAALAWLFLDEALDARQLVALGLAVVGVVLVQVAPLVRSRAGASPG